MFIVGHLDLLIVEEEFLQPLVNLGLQTYFENGLGYIFLLQGRKRLKT